MDNKKIKTTQTFLKNGNNPNADNAAVNAFSNESIVKAAAEQILKTPSTSNNQTNVSKKDKPKKEKKVKVKEAKSKTVVANTNKKDKKKNIIDESVVDSKELLEIDAKIQQEKEAKQDKLKKEEETKFDVLNEDMFSKEIEDKEDKPKDKKSKKEKTKKSSKKTDKKETLNKDDKSEKDSKDKKSNSKKKNKQESTNTHGKIITKSFKNRYSKYRFRGKLYKNPGQLLDTFIAEKNQNYFAQRLLQDSRFKNFLKAHCKYEEDFEKGLKNFKEICIKIEKAGELNGEF